ncbi:membrane protein DedA, SNARE-associated domain [Caloramator fervidus]|uniref:Membrane protein DedA, SNARE-associated domain n=1 Tax=Caloramator fervidus TaxID=29344 RepID=A0A1H5SLY3_9CLOT|nr:VTT domain-containing protein [Caloramator fervidus]SEF50968.1 membrane protein DedA, SNARE-associated domain [Caloramator fervidus]
MNIEIFKILSYLKNNPSIAYIFSILNSFLQIFFPPYPGDSLIALLGYLSYLNIINGYVILSLTIISTFLSSYLLLYISYNFSNIIVNSYYFKKLFNLHSLEKFEKWYKKIGPFLLVIGKFIPGINSIIIIGAGLFKIDIKLSLLSIAISTILHNSMFFIAGKIAGENLKFLKTLIKEYTTYILLGITLLYLGYLLIKKIFRE